jgi:hypothetical protein
MVSASGHFDVQAIFSAQAIANNLKPSGSCDGWGGNSYQIQIKSGTGAILALASFSSGAYTASSDGSSQTMQCSFTYSFSVAQYSLYTIVLYSVSDTGNPYETHTVALADLRAHGAPPLFRQENYCPEC